MPALGAHEPQRIILIDWSMIGDLVMLSPCVKAIRGHYPEAHLAILGQPTSIAPYKTHPAVNQLIAYDRSGGDYDFGSFFRTVNEIKQGQFDLAYIFHNSIGSAIMAWLGQVKARVGYRYEMRDLLLTKRIRMSQEREHLIETKANLLRASGLSVNSIVEEVFVDQAKGSKWIRSKLGPNLGRNRPIVVVGVGATMKYKQWSAAGLNIFLNRFPVNSVDFVFTGSPSDRELYHGVYSYNNTVVDLVGQTTLEELTWVLDKANMYVGPDSGPLHLAVGLKTPVVALFGATDPTKCGPYKYLNSLIVRTHRLCGDCERDFGKNIRQCLHTLMPDEVYEATAELLSQTCQRWSP